MTRAKGTEYENYVRDTFLRPTWSAAERAAQSGIRDFGDFTGVGGWLIEAKKWDRWNLPLWIRKVLNKVAYKPAPWMIVFAADKRGPIPMDLVVMPAEQFFGSILHREMEGQQ